MTTCMHGLRVEYLVKKVEYEGLSILLSFVATIEMFEKMNWYMEVVDDDIVLEAIGVEHPEHSIEDEER